MRGGTGGRCAAEAIAARRVSMLTLTESWSMERFA
jgi:hypothetical protein